jgi:hypothetical protein
MTGPVVGCARTMGARLATIRPLDRSDLLATDLVLDSVCEV